MTIIHVSRIKVPVYSRGSRIYRENSRLRAENRRLEEENKELKDQAIHDPLTGLLNKRAFGEMFERVLAEALRYRHPLAVVMADIDHFKIVNDTYGHQAGDKVLKEVAGILGKALRKNDIVARYGGEEFILVLNLTPSNELEKTTYDKARESARIPLERIRQMVEAAVIQDEKKRDVKVTISLGYAILYPSDRKSELSRQMLIGAADEALYEAKHAGRNRVVGKG
ncbi:MAG: GGDEF domain-containing protein [Candidatus Margulisbacteria bacterium]|nr:GGDEF domain-containing protein [Candidatus Margulisiibacteriota bacterium]